MFCKNTDSLGTIQKDIIHFKSFMGLLYTLNKMLVKVGHVIVVYSTTLSSQLCSTTLIMSRMLSRLLYKMASKMNL